MKPIFKLILLAAAYLLTYILGSCTGLIHPACYAYVGAVLPLLTAFIYLLTCATVRGFGAATLLNGFVFVMLLIAGEADTALAIGFAILTALAEIIRYFCKYDTLKGVRWSFIPLAAAVEEMRAGYDQLMIPVIDNIPVLIVVLVLTIPVAILAMRLAERSLKKQTEGLK